MTRRKTIEQFIIDANNIHGDRYDYSLVDYKNAKEKVKIICSIHGVFEQIPDSHLRGRNCPLCAIDEIRGYKNPFYGKKHTAESRERISKNRKGKGCGRVTYSKGLYHINNIPRFDLFYKQLSPFGIECKRNEEDSNILEVKCYYCGKWFIPKLYMVRTKVSVIKGLRCRGEQNLYCSDWCKYSCSTYGQKLYPKDFKPATSREVQPQLRKLVLERDNWICQKCGSTEELHCHHIDPVKENPIESADIDNCITYCKKCHKKAHQQSGCGYYDLAKC